MLLPNRYEMSVIVDAWKRYKAMQVCRVLRDGKWHISKAKFGQRPDGIRAMVTTADKAMSFPKFLKEYYGD